MIAALLLCVAQKPSPYTEFGVPCPKGSHEPQISVGTNGHVALAWGTRERISCCYGDPADQASFQRVHTMPEKLSYSVGMRRGPRIEILTGDQIVLTAIGGEKGGGKDGDLLAWRSLPEKETWSVVQRINSTPGTAREGLHAMARGAHGELYCAWIDLRSGRPQVYGALSRDGGATWVNEGLVSGDAEICPCCAPSTCFDGESAACVMWRGVSKGARDMQLARSSDGGKTFGAAAKLGTGTWKLDACPMDGGVLVVIDGKATGIWRREQSIFMAADDLSERLLGTGMQPWATHSADRVVWIEERGGKLHSYLPRMQESVVLADDACDPVVASAPGGRAPIYVAWESGTAGESRIHLRLVARLAPR